MNDGFVPPTPYSHTHAHSFLLMDICISHLHIHSTHYRTLTCTFVTPHLLSHHASRHGLLFPLSYHIHRTQTQTRHGHCFLGHFTSCYRRVDLGHFSLTHGHLVLIYGYGTHHSHSCLIASLNQSHSLLTYFTLRQFRFLNKQTDRQVVSCSPSRPFHTSRVRLLTPPTPLRLPTCSMKLP